MIATRPVTADDVIKALALPERARVNQRVPKKMLAEHGAPTAADRRLLTDGIEELQWIAALKPSTVAIPEHRVDGREYLEVAVLSVKVRVTHGRASQSLRLAELVHRAVPYPVLLIQALTLSAAATPKDSTPKPSTQLALSLAHKRAAQNEPGKVVLDGELVRSELIGTDSTAASVVNQLLGALALSCQPHQDLLALYQGWMECLIAAEAARLTGNFCLPNGPTAAAAQREALRTCQRLEQEAARLRSQAAKERQIAKQVDLNLELQRLDACLRMARAQL
jgi:cell division septum initiation protein DivIVA